MNKIVAILLVFFFGQVFGQEKERQEVFKTDSTWIKEIIEFPISFAKDIKYKGFEDLRLTRVILKGQ